MGGVQGTPLCEAVKANDPGLLTRLLASGSDPNEGCEFDGAIALHYAAMNHLFPGATNMVRQLLKAGANPNARTTDAGRMMPLHHAAQNGAHEIAALLLDAGARIDARENGYGRTALMLAAAHGHDTCVALLVDHGADVFKMTKGGGQSGMPPMNALDCALSGKSHHDRADAKIAAAGEMEKVALLMSKQQQLGTTGDHAAVMKRLKAAGVTETPGVPTTFEEAEALAKEKGTGVKDEFKNATDLERMQGVHSESTEAYEERKALARDAIADQRAESEAARGRKIEPGALACETCAAVPETKPMACARCHTTRYCSRACQKAHWPIHKKYCKTLAAGK